MEWFARWGPGHFKYAEAECELGRAAILQGLREEGRTRLEHCLPIYRASGQADRDIVRASERLLFR
jgi:hypothetical protein